MTTKENLIKENLKLTKAIKKLERKHRQELKKEYERGWNNAIEYMDKVVIEPNKPYN